MKDKIFSGFFFFFFSLMERERKFEEKATDIIICKRKKKRKKKPHCKQLLALYKQMRHQNLRSPAKHKE